MKSSDPLRLMKIASVLRSYKLGHMPRSQYFVFIKNPILSAHPYYLWYLLIITRRYYCQLTNCRRCHRSKEAQYTRKWQRYGNGTRTQIMNLPSTEIFLRTYIVDLKMLREKMSSYQQLFEETKIGKHANNDENRHILPNPDKVESKWLSRPSVRLATLKHKQKK